MFLYVNKHANSTFQTLLCYRVEGRRMYGVPSAVCI